MKLLNGKKLLKVCFLEVDLEYPAEMHDEHNDFPLAPESLVLNGFPKLTQNLMEKSEWFYMGKI